MTLVAFMIVAIPISGFAVETFSPNGLAGKLSFACGETDSYYDSADVPAAFSEEVLNLDAYGDVRVSSDGRVVGFDASASLQETYAAVETKLEQGGWTAIPSGRDGCATFRKGAGSYTWLLVSCTEVNGQTSVVIQSDGGRSK